MKTSLFIELPQDFSFKATVYSHGWCELAPFELDEENWRLRYVFSEGNGGVLRAEIFEEGSQVRIDLERPPADPSAVMGATRRILRLDDDLRQFYDLVSRHDHLGWIGERRAGRLLRSPTVFEDLVKTICTTNCSWALTKAMVKNLVEKLGAGPTSSASHGSAFPTPESMAARDETFYRDEIRAGYRAAYLIELAESVASGRLCPEEWLTTDLTTEKLKKEIKKVKGVGDYAAEHLLKLVGRYDGLALDSWLRSQFYKRHNREKSCPDKRIERHYKKFGRWRALVIWCDMTERWHVADQAEDGGSPAP